MTATTPSIATATVGVFVAGVAVLLLLLLLLLGVLAAAATAAAAAGLVGGLPFPIVNQTTFPRRPRPVRDRSWRVTLRRESRAL